MFDRRTGESRAGRVARRGVCCISCRCGGAQQVERRVAWRESMIAAFRVLDADSDNWVAVGAIKLEVQRRSGDEVDPLLAELPADEDARLRLSDFLGLLGFERNLSTESLPTKSLGISRQPQAWSLKSLLCWLCN
mmetsp:Transcript_126549/g.404293  ORF Transcript_126549/g.404293 Transcript_126549/m.404293 type:complete len:135 (+) Transcript_126549:1195-1599(+)